MSRVPIQPDAHVLGLLDGHAPEIVEGVAHEQALRALLDGDDGEVGRLSRTGAHLARVRELSDDDYIIGDTAGDVFSVAHGLGKGVLSAFGAGAAGDAIEQLEQQAGAPITSSEPKVQSAAAATSAAAASATSAATGKAPMLTRRTSLPPSLMSAPTPPPRRWPLVVAAVGGVGLVLALVGALVSHRKDHSDAP